MLIGQRILILNVWKKVYNSNVQIQRHSLRTLDTLILIRIYWHCFICVNVSGFNLTRVMKWKGMKWQEKERERVHKDKSKIIRYLFIRRFPFQTVKIVSWIENSGRISIYMFHIRVSKMGDPEIFEIISKSFVLSNTFHTWALFCILFFHRLELVHCSLVIFLFSKAYKNASYQIKINPSKSHLNFLCFSFAPPRCFFRYFPPARKMYITDSIKSFKNKKEREKNSHEIIRKDFI